MKKTGYQVHKYGGSSLASPESYYRVARQVLAFRDERNEKPIVVVSARQGLTNTLHHLVEKAVSGAGFYLELERLRCRQQLFCRDIFARGFWGQASQMKKAETIRNLDKEFLALHLDLMRLQEDGFSEDVFNRVVGLGEIWSASMLTSVIQLEDDEQMTGRTAQWLNARSFLFRSNNGGEGEMDLTRSRKAINQIMGCEYPSIYVVTGYICSSAEGRPSNLGRNGSDFSGSLLAALLDAETLTIWSDVDGILSIDPDLSSEAETLESVTFDEAMELARLEAGVLHAHTLAPLLAMNVEIDLKNTLNPHRKGSRVLRKTAFSNGIATGLSKVVMFKMRYKGDFCRDYSDMNSHLMLVNSSGVSRSARTTDSQEPPCHQKNQDNVSVSLGGLQFSEPFSLAEHEKGPVILAVRQIEDSVFLACSPSRRDEVELYLRELQRKDEQESLEYPEIMDVITGSMIAWVGHDMRGRKHENRVWDEFMGKLGESLVFQTEEIHSRVAFLTGDLHGSQTCLLHKAMKTWTTGRRRVSNG